MPSSLLPISHSHNSQEQQMNTQQNAFKRRKISPLIIFSQQHQNKTTPKHQQICSLLESQHAKINHRYAQVMGEEEGEERVQPQQRSRPSAHSHKSESFFRNPRTKSGRIYSLQRSRPNQVKYQKSPYMSEHKRRNKTEQQAIKEIPNQSIASILKNRIEKNKNVKKCGEKVEVRLLKENIEGADRIFKHFINIQVLGQRLKQYKGEADILDAVRSYVLEEEGDSAEIQNIYTSETITLLCKKILFLQKILMILVVDVVVMGSLRIVSSLIKTSLGLLHDFYWLVHRDLCSANLSNSQGNQMGNEVKKLLCEMEKKKPILAFQKIEELLLAKIKHCFKYSKKLQHFYKANYQNVGTFTTNLSYFRLLQFYAMRLLEVDWKHWNLQFLQTCPSPYLHYQAEKPLTLLLDLDETLIHYTVRNKMQGQFLIRPHLFQFLQEMSTMFQIGIFTCSMPEYADIIINHMKHVQFRLYRHHTIKIKGEFVKDLERVGRDLARVLLLDNIEQNFRLQRRNGIHIRSWYGDKKDNMLERVGKQLRKVAGSGCEDVRKLNFERSFV